MVDFTTNLVMNMVNKQTPMLPPDIIKPGGAPSNFIPQFMQQAQANIQQQQQQQQQDAVRGWHTPDQGMANVQPPQEFQRALNVPPDQHLMERKIVRNLYR